MDASESHPVQLTVLEEIDAGQYSRVTVEKGQALRMKEFGAELVEVAAIEDRPQAVTAAGEVMALDWGITLQCDTTGKEEARIRVDVTKEQWQQYQKHISGNKIWIGIDEKDVMLLK